MKAEINNENKARVFSLYWGQEVYRHRTWGIGEKSWDIQACVMDLYSIKSGHLLLKPISQISDEDMKGVANLVGFDDELDPDWKDNLQELIEHLQGLDAFLILGDYFRSKGYALPWLRLSVEEMIQAGWIKLTES